MSQKLVYNSIFVHFFRAISWAILWASRYKVVGGVPKIDKMIVIAAPHTSNWDFPIFIAMVFNFRMQIRFLGKHTLFNPALGWLMYWLGGIPVDRSGKDARNMVRRAAALFDEDEMILGIAPEGTRSKVGAWKTGFYRIAVAANVPILLAYIDASTRELGFGEVFYPTGDMKADIATIQAFYADKVGIKPKNKGF